MRSNAASTSSPFERAEGIGPGRCHCAALCLPRSAGRFGIMEIILLATCLYVGVGGPVQPQPQQQSLVRFVVFCLRPATLQQLVDLVAIRALLKRDVQRRPKAERS